MKYREDRKKKEKKKGLGRVLFVLCFFLRVIDVKNLVFIPWINLCFSLYFACV